MTILTPASAPKPIVIEGKYCRLEPLNMSHAKDLFNAISGGKAEANHQYLFETPPASQAELETWIAKATSDQSLSFFGVIDLTTGKCAGRQALMRSQPEHGSIEIGSILWGAGIAKTARATEALYLCARHIFEDLGYRRFEWKCNNLNAPSKRAALRFGFQFEGIFRQHMIVKNANRDTAWFSMIDQDWPALKQTYLAWLAPSNFNQLGEAKTSLATSRQPTPVQY